MIPVRKKPQKPASQLSELLTPTMIGKTRFPEPKNIEKIENPYKKTCRFIANIPEINWWLLNKEIKKIICGVQSRDVYG